MVTILPKLNINVDYPDPQSLIFFLAGPVLGGGDWQYSMCRLLQERITSFYVAVPCRYPRGHPLRRHEARDGMACVGDFERQLDWERHYLNLAAVRGSIIFWLGCESATNPRADGNPYGRDTYGELGEWRGRLMHNRALNVVFGADPRFPGLDVIRRNFNQALGGYVHFCPSMEELADKVTAKVLRRESSNVD